MKAIKLILGYKIYLFLLLSLSVITYVSYSQKNKHKLYVVKLFDKKNGNTFILDTKKINVFAYNKKGKLLWKTDPYMDAYLPHYLIARPTITYFKLGNFAQKDVIFISYNNKQFGYILRANGKFYFQGQD